MFLYYLSTATTLTSWHLLVTFCSLHVALKMKLFEHKPFERKAVLGFGILNGISIGLLNLSLGFNSVGFYQVWSFLLSCNRFIAYLIFEVEKLWVCLGYKGLKIPISWACVLIRAKLDCYSIRIWVMHEFWSYAPIPYCFMIFMLVLLLLLKSFLVWLCA